MPAVQTVYNAVHPQYYAGMIGDQEPYRIFTRIAQANIAFGAPVFLGTTGDYSVQPTPANGAAFEGFAVLSHAILPDAGDLYGTGTSINVMSFGLLVTTAAVAVNARQPVYVDSNGNVTNVAANNTALPNCVFENTITAPGLVMVRMN